MNTYGFTLLHGDGLLASWIIKADTRKAAFDELNSVLKDGNEITILTCKLSAAQESAWVQAAVEHGGFDDQMASSILSVY